MTLHRRLTVLALASIPLGCPDDSTPADDETSGTTGNDDNDDNDDDPSSVTLTTDPDTSSTDPSTTVDPDSSTDPTEDPTTETTEDPTTETTEDPTTETTEDPTTESSSSTDAESSSSSTTETAGDGCAQFQVTGDLAVVGGGNVFRFTAADISGASNPAIDDFLQFQFYAADTGSFDLALAPNDNFATCEQCILVYEDVVKGDAARFFYQSEGTIDVDADSDVLGGALFYGSVTGVRLIEVTIDPDTAVSTPVADGLCIDLVDGDVGTIEVPDAWTCDPAFYGSGIEDDCDCGCGVVDADCIDMTAGSCDFCNDEGACSEGGGACPSNIDPVDNSQCVADEDESQALVQGPGLALAIADDTYNGNVNTMSCVTLPLAASGASDTVTAAQLDLGMAHTFVGDLVVKVISPVGTVVTVLSRPGFVEVLDDGVGGFGDSANLLATSPITFVNAGVTDAETMGATLVATDDVVCEDDSLCVYDPNPGVAVAGDFAAFVGQNAVGDWRVCVGDGAPGDIGTIDRVTLTIDQG